VSRRHNPRRQNATAVYFGVTEKRVIIYFMLRSFLSTDCEAPLLFSFRAKFKVENLRFSSFLLKLFFLPPFSSSRRMYIRLRNEERRFPLKIPSPYSLPPRAMPSASFFAKKVNL
jgi:hypothetical protein